MDLLDTFLRGLAEQGFTKAEIRILDAERLLKQKIGKDSISKFSKKYKINSGSVSAMLSGRRAIPITLLDEMPSEFVCILHNCNVPIKIPKELTKDLAYLVGLLRDGTINQEKHGEYTCAFYSKNMNFLKVIKPKIEKLFGLNLTIEKFGDCYGVRVRSKTLYLFFKIVFDFICPQEKWNTPELIKIADDKIKRAYIGGFFDAEGGIPHLESLKKPKRKNLYLKFVQKNKESLIFIKDHLYSLGIESGKVYWSDNKNNLKIKMSSIKLCSHYIESLHPEKANRLVMLNRLLAVL